MPPAPTLSRQSWLYQTGDEGVREALPLNHTLPLRSRAEIDMAVGTLETVVDSRGIVESVRLKSTDNSLRDRRCCRRKLSVLNRR